MKKGTKGLINLAIIVVTLGVVLLVGFQGNSWQDVITAVTSLSPEWLALCLVAWLAYIGFDALSMYLFLKLSGHPIPYWRAYYTSIIGLYYSNITPGATGGQPMQVYSLSQCGVPVGVGTSSITVKFTTLQSALVIMGAALWITFPEFVNTQTQGFTVFLRLGTFINSLAVVLVVLLAVNKTLVRGLLHGIVNLLTKIHIVKHPDQVHAKCDDTMASFHASVYMLRHEKLHLLLQMLLSIAQMTCLMLVVVFVYHAFGLSGCSDLKLITLGLMLYMSVSYTPLPGASGMQEGGFAIFFAGIFPETTLFTALLLWRFFTYYISLIVGAAVTTGFSIGSLLRKKKKSSRTKE